MAKWNRRQFLNGLLAAAGADATFATRDAFALAQELPSISPIATARDPRPDPPAAPTASRSVPAAEGERPAAGEGEDGRHPLQEVLPEGLRFGRWRIVSVLPIQCGAVPVILETRAGVRFQVDVLRRDPRQGAKRGIAETRAYALYLSNLGRGMKPTREEHGLGLIWLAALLRARERGHRRAALLTLRERLTQHPGGRFDALAAARTRAPAVRG